MAPIGDDVARAASILRAGGLVAFPTETVYGLGANALDPAAVARIYEAKGRPSNSPLIVHVSSIEMAQKLAEEWPDAAMRLARRYWPGPLTLIVRKRPSIPDIVTAGLPSVGIRIPDHPLALALIETAGVPLAAPSANRFTQLSPTTAQHVAAGLADRVDYILDGGPTSVGIESTVVSVAESEARLLRPGMISLAVLEAVIGPVAMVAGPAIASAHEAPGMHRRHYQPRTPLVVGDPPSTGRAIYLYRTREHPAAARNVRMPADPAGFAASLYDTLHRLDEEGWDWIAVEPIPSEMEWAGIADRLMRAAAESGPDPTRS